MHFFAGLGIHVVPGDLPEQFGRHRRRCRVRRRSPVPYRSVTVRLAQSSPAESVEMLGQVIDGLGEFG